MPPLRVMKFGGTSVGDAACIARAAAIVKSAASQGSVVVVVSAMSGVTNRLIDAAHHAEAGEAEFATKLVAELRNQHTKALETLIREPRRAGWDWLGVGSLSPGPSEVSLSALAVWTIHGLFLHCRHRPPHPCGATEASHCPWVPPARIAVDHR